MKTKYVECACRSGGHNLRLTWFEDEPDELYLEKRLSTSRGFFMRAWLGLQYIFNVEPSKMMYEETVLYRTHAAEFKALLDEFLTEGRS